MTRLRRQLQELTKRMNAIEVSALTVGPDEDQPVDTEPEPEPEEKP